MRTFMNFGQKLCMAAAIALSLTLPCSPLSAQTAPATQTPAPSGKRAAAPTAAAPTSQEIADAKSKGLVWVNTSTKVYHKDGSFYGTTKRGKFMTEDDASKAGYRAAKTPGASKKTPGATNPSK